MSDQQTDLGLSPWISRTADDGHESIYSADSRNVRSLLSTSEISAVTPAQAYASAVKTGEAHERALYYTIERKQPERKGKVNPHFMPLHGDPGFREHGSSFAQRLYASALNHKPSSSPSNIPVLPPIKYVSSSVLPISGGSQATSDVPPRTTPFSPSFDTRSEVSQSFNPADLYHKSVTSHGLPSRGLINPELHAKPPRSQIPNTLLSVARSHSDNPQATHSPPSQNPRPVSHQFQTVSTEAQSYSTPIVSIHEAAGLQGASIDTHPPTIASGDTPLEQLLMDPPPPSPPAFEEHEQVFGSPEEVVAAVAPAVTQSLTVIPYQGGLPDSLLQPPLEVNHEEVPLYSLVDEQLPPPAFDDVQVLNSPEACPKTSLVARCETLPQEAILVTEPPSLSQSLPPSSHGSTAHAPEEAPAYALLGNTYPLGMSKNMLQDVKVPPPSVVTGHTSGASSSDKPNVVPTDFQSPKRTPSLSPPISLLPSNFRPLSMLSPDCQSINTSRDPRSVYKGTAILPPPVNYYTKPTAKPSGRPLLPPPALRRYTSQPC